MQSHSPIDADALAPYLGGREFEALWQDYEREGYVILPQLLDAETLAGLRAALEPHFDKQGRNNFEGLKTHRVYGLLAKSALFADLAMHPLALAFAERELGGSFLLSACLAINLLPGESVQPWHSDDGYVHLPRPRPACGVSAFWAIDETTEENGATEILPRSHLWDRDGAPETMDGVEAIKVTLPAGGLMLAKGTLIHRGGANTSDASRLIITPQYCAGWMRQIENMVMSVPPDIAATYPERTRELLGYSIHPPFIGYVDGVHPRRSLPAV